MKTNFKKALETYETTKAYYELISKTKNINTLKEMYEYFKTINHSKNNIGDIYNLTLFNMIKAEKVFKDQYLVDTSFKLNIDEDKVLDKSNEEEILKYIIFKIRKKLVKSIYWNNITMLLNNNFNPNLVNYCYDSSMNIKQICDSLLIKNFLVEIHPGYSENSNLLKGNGFHYANIIKLKNYYLIDVTYSQFFSLGVTNIERLGLINYPLTKAGCFMMMSEDRKQVALKILKDGFVKLDENTFKHYLDGFTISFRNGLYYKNTGDYTYTTNYTTSDYIKFLTKRDNQINHEGMEVLGYQKHL